MRTRSIFFKFNQPNLKRYFYSKTLVSNLISTKLEQYQGQPSLSIQDSNSNTLFIINKQGYIDANLTEFPRLTCYAEDRLYGKNSEPTLLYAISQASWEAFIQQLPYKQTVKYLNLQEHRHLWPAYNFAVDRSDPINNNYLAKSFGQYHFLFDLIKNNCLSIAESAEKRADFFKRLATEESIFALIKSIKPHYSLNLLDKFAHCPYWEEFESLADALILNEAPYWKFALPKQARPSIQTIEQKNERPFMPHFPSSTKHPDLFADVLRRYKTLKNFCQSENQAIRFLSHSYQKTANSVELEAQNQTNHPLNEYLDAVTNDLIFPEYLRQGGELHQGYTPAYLLREWLGLAMADQIPFEKLNQLQKRWHSKINAINAAKPPLYADHYWYALFEPLTLENVKFSCLTNSKELTIKAGEFNNCLDSFFHKCLNGNVHVISLNSELGGHSILEIQILNGKAVFAQHEAKLKKPPSELHKRVADTLIKGINQGRIPLVKSKQAYQKDYYLYPLNNKNAQNKVYLAYCSSRVLPFFMKASSYEEMLEKSGLKQTISDYAAARKTFTENRYTLTNNL